METENIHKKVNFVLAIILAILAIFVLFSMFKEGRRDGDINSPENAAALGLIDEGVLNEAENGATQENQDLMTAVIFLHKAGEGDSCENVSLAYRTVPKTVMIAGASLRSLFLGPTETEASRGYYTNLNENILIDKLEIENMVATLEIKDENYNWLSECQKAGYKAELEKTLLQFDTVDSATISVNNTTI